jgi:N-acyl-phosphatidylethanolamine-hydrolysing phospholipase D
VVNGYLIEHQAPDHLCRIYWTGDTVWFDELNIIQQKVGPLDVLVPHLGAVGVDGPFGMMTLNSAEAARMIELFRPKSVIPIHHHTFSHYVEPVEILQDMLHGTQSELSLHILKEGDSYVV